MDAFCNTPLFDTPAARHWRTALNGALEAGRAQEITDFESEIALKRQGKIEDKVFAETRLRHGVYGQRYDNGKRHDGTALRDIAYPTPATKGAGTVWDAPGMQRIKIPYGGVSALQLETLAALAEEYSDGILHVTTRQDVQLHFVHVEDTPALFRRLAAVGITTREACGNAIRNVTACPSAGACSDESFDVTPYADAAFKFLLGHPDAQDFGRKFKVSFSGCAHKPCALARIHDVGFIAATRLAAGKTERGFAVYVGGGLGAIPYQAALLDEFVPETEFLPLTQSICRVFALHGEKKNRNKARLKFLVADWGIEKFKNEVLNAKATLPFDARWTGFLKDLKSDATPPPEPQKNSLTLCLPLGDFTADQARALADILRKHGANARTTVTQNILVRDFEASRATALQSDLVAAGFSLEGADSIADIVACPGTDTCKLGISSSRGLSAVLQDELLAKLATMDTAVRDLRIKISGCFNACAQHHVADIGFYGVSRKVGNYLVPHFQLVLGGTTAQNGAAYGLAVMAMPSKAVPRALERLTNIFVAERVPNESFGAFVARLGKTQIKNRLADLAEVPDHAIDASSYVDFADVREYSKSDIGIGECAGEIVSQAEFGLKSAEREIFAAQLKLDVNDAAGAATQSLEAMLCAAEGLVRNLDPFFGDKAALAATFRTLYCDSGLFLDPFAGDRFANFFFKALAADTANVTLDEARRRVEEAQLFIDAAHACLARTVAA